MVCDSCGRPVQSGAGLCTACEQSPPREDRPAAAQNRYPLVTDGGEDDPLADPTDEDEEEKYEYLEPEDIVGEEAGEGADTADQPPEGQAGEPSQGGGEEAPDPGGQQDGGPADQPPAGEPSTDQPAAPQNGGQQGEPPGEQADDPPETQPEQSGQPQDDPPETQPEGQPQDAPQGDQAAEHHQSGQPQEAQQGGQPLENQPAGTGGAGAATGTAEDALGGSQQTTQEEEGGLVEELKQYPLKLGTALGLIAFLVPYILISLATFFGYEKPPGENPGQETAWTVVDGSASWTELDVSAELFFYVIEFGRGAVIVDLFRRSADVVRPSEVNPADYPTVEDELGPLLELLAFDAFPEVPLLLLYIIAPYILFTSARYLARNYTPGERPHEYAIAGATVTIGTTFVALVLGLVFPVTDFASRLLVAGILLPAAIGAVGGVSIYSFDDHSALVSTLTGWAAMAAGFIVAFLLLPLPDLDGAELQLSLLDRIVFAVGAYLNTAQFNIGSHTQGRLFFILVVALTIAAGFVRTWQSREDIEDRIDGVRVGASIFIGFLGTVALLLWAFPMGTALTDLSLFSTVPGNAADISPGFSLYLAVQPEALAEGSRAVPVSTIRSVTGVASYLKAILVAGVIFPMTFGGLGGYLAVWFRDR